ncbi:vacuolar protein sorting/targeting protein PEP1, partial [Spiromyces aspiralis]
MLALAAFASLSLPGLARAENPKTPEIIATYFSNSLTKVVQFGSSKAWLAIDSVDGVIYRTGDRGRSWSEIKDIPRGLATYLHVHPFDDDTAFVLGEGTKHYVTHDRGQTWTQFTTPLPPISNGEKPLRFHAGRVDSILFSGERCVEDNRWWLPRLNCHEETFYTTEGFRHSNSRSLESLLGEGVPVRQCQWARLKTEFKEMPEQTIMCLVPPDGSDAGPARRSSRLVWEKRFDSTQSISNATGATSREEAASMPQRAPLYSQRHNLFDFGLRDGGNKSTGLRLAISQDYFATKRVVSFGGGDQTGGGVIGVNVVSRFIIAAVQHARSEETDLFVSLDGHTWAESRLPLPAGVSENAYTLLESTPHALLIDVVMSSGSYGTIFKSNSNGTYYTPSLAHAYRNKNGLVDVERVQGLEGVILANQVSNWDKFDWRHGWHFLNRPEIQTRISFDDGAHWSYLRAPTHGLDGKGYGCTEDGWRIGDCALHVHSVTSVHNPGFVYSTKASPGIIMAVGSVGKHLASWKDCDTFLSTDGGLTWKQVHKDAHLYEFVDSGSTLLLVNNEGPTDTAVYSVDRGETWHEVRLGERIHAYATINDNLGIDNGLMILGRVSDGNNKGKFVVLSVGFEGVWSRQCDFNPEDPKENDDIEKWVLRADKNSECVMGHKAIHFRRRAAAQCYMDATRVSLPVSEDCPCEEKDYECDYNYALDPSTGKCVLVGPEVIPRGQCQREGDRFMASPGYRLIPGDTCDYERGKQLDRPVDKACPRAIDAPSGGVVTHSLTTFRHSIVIDPFVNSTHYLLHSSNGDVFLSKDEGISWERVDLSNVVDSNDRALAVVKHGYVASRAFVYMVSGVMVVTDDFGVTWRRMDKLPAPVNGLAITPIFSFHPDRPDWMLYMGGTECPKCHTEVYLTKDGGRVWNKVTTHAEKCLFAHANRFVSLPEDAVLCSVWKYKSGKKGYQDIVREEAPPENLLQLL